MLLKMDCWWNICNFSGEYRTECPLFLLRRNFFISVLIVAPVVHLIPASVHMQHFSLLDQEKTSEHLFCDPIRHGILDTLYFDSMICFWPFPFKKGIFCSYLYPSLSFNEAFDSTQVIIILFWWNKNSFCCNIVVLRQFIKQPVLLIIMYLCYLDTKHLFAINYLFFSFRQN